MSWICPLQEYKVRSEFPGKGLSSLECSLKVVLDGGSCEDGNHFYIIVKNGTFHRTMANHDAPLGQISIDVPSVLSFVRTADWHRGGPLDHVEEVLWNESTDNET